MQQPINPKAIFPTYGSLDEAVNAAISRLPINNTNELLSVLMSYHNTLLQEINKVKQCNL